MSGAGAGAFALSGQGLIEGHSEAGEKGWGQGQGQRKGQERRCSLPSGTPSFSSLMLPASGPSALRQDCSHAP